MRLTLFEPTQVLFPPPPLEKSARYTLGKGRHGYGFGVDFSLLSLYAQAELSHNPYFRACRHWDCTRIYYGICVTVKGCGLFRRPGRKSIYLVSANLDPPGIPRLPPSKGLPRQSFQGLHFDAPGLRSERSREDNKVPPPYTPALVLRAGIGSDGGLPYAGGSLPLKLWVRVPLAAQGQLKAVLKSVRLFMVDPTVISNCGRRVVRPAGTFIREVQLDIALQTRSSKNEIFEFTSVLVPVDVATPGAPPKYEALDIRCRHHLPEEGLPEYRMEISSSSGS
ncbi:hypothetical protein INS49_004288 [Diaporthe citri]|uniref:uncharacterized protein n=1 Tax=Diaporthe citri TaxID=83186 RepID=UPI001C812E51|nr:uncharacterized protein INS49_004288 [Diaporthe citri]KAG6355207.1 hypothetical protein INS49_004288 [Diaporthe citri]